MNDMNDHCCPTKLIDMNLALTDETVAGKDAGVEPTGMYSRHVSAVSAEFMPGTE